MGSLVIWNASQQIVERGKRIAGQILDRDPASIRFEDGHFRTDDGEKSAGLFEVAAAAAHMSDLPEELRGPLAATCEQLHHTPSFPYGSHVCEVEVDPELGTLEIINYVAVDDVGRAVNPLLVHGQIHGGIAQGVGQALLEQSFYDSSTGQLYTGSLMDYAIPRADNLPSFTAEISEVPSPTHPLGMCPAGEAGTTGALGVTINAVVDALSEYGVTHIEMPATPERVWRAIRGEGAAAVQVPTNR